ncbi:MAG TPA: HEAT repeat domain-containing protein [Methanothrix sp.]|mgnify:CR=1 FL=1|nr:HEAT repeat domain-containing protein [Methanothrix sp.]HPJ84043.1 HEAT repeat domain-containing protein [Methanothrix sp.]HPR66048.1 HEAT repeat domain-containing protein [Methanothrix sp.]
MDQDELHSLVVSRKATDRMKAARSLKSSFIYFQDRVQAMEDLSRLLKDPEPKVRAAAIDALAAAFCEIPDKKRAWNYFLELAQDDNRIVKMHVAYSIKSSLELIPMNDPTWYDLLKSTQDAILKLTQDTDTTVLRAAAILLGSSISYIPDKDLAYRDLRRLVSREHRPEVRNGAVIGIGFAIPYTPNINEACQIIYALSKEREGFVREGAAIALGLAFQYSPDRVLAFENIINLIHDQNMRVRWMATEALGLSFRYVSDRTRAWVELVERTTDSSLGTKKIAIDALKSSFPYVLDKNQAWKDLFELTNDTDEIVRSDAAFALKYVVGQVSEIEVTWADLVDLTEHRDPFVRGPATDAIGLAFIRVPDKNKAWKDIDRLARVEDAIVRAGIAAAIGSFFSQIPDGDSAWTELIRLTEDIDSHVRMNAYHSLGRASVLKATETTNLEDLKKELEHAVDYFSCASKEDPRLNPAKFCYPFYRSYYSIVFQKATDDEVQKYLTDSREAVGRSKSKEDLLKVIDDLAKALNNAQKLKGGSQDDIIENLNAHRQYCEDAANRMASVEETAPVTIKLLRSGNIIIENRIKGIIDEIHDKAKRIQEIAIKSNPESIEKTLISIGSSVKSYDPCIADIVILTVLQEEYRAVTDKLSNLRLPPKIGPDENKYSWRFGEVPCTKYRSVYTIIVGKIGAAGTIKSALAAFEATILWNPSYIFLVGVAGGFSGLSKADVVIAEEIRGYEYGKIDDGFIPRDDWHYCTEPELLRSAIDFSISSEWLKYIQLSLPSGCEPKVINGEFASGDKVVDNPSDPFFTKVLKKWPDIIAVEMEGIGVGHATEHVKRWRERGSNITGFLMVRGISDLPRTASSEEERGTKERDNWKPWAADTAAAFAIGMIAEGLPLRPLLSNAVSPS